MFGVGFIIGPVLGGFLGDIWVRAPFIAAAILNGLNFLLALFVLPESRSAADRSAVKFELANLNPLKPLGWALAMRGLLPLIAVFFVFNFLGQMYGTAWALWGQDTFQWNGLMVGLSLGAFGLFHAMAQVFVPGPAVKRFGERNTMFIGMACECLSLLAIGISNQPWVVFVIMPLFALGGIGVPALQSLTTQQADADSQGKLQGVLASITSLASIVGPLFFSAVYFGVRGTWPGLIWIVGVAIYVLAIPLIFGIRGRAPSSTTA
jgi:DHA1 family tetracycline resistance protein-like MFS transporter